VLFLYKGITRILKLTFTIRNIKNSLSEDGKFMKNGIEKLLNYKRVIFLWVPLLPLSRITSYSCVKEPVL